MFIGRTKELSTLEKLYKSDKFQFSVIYGRRRVGKTSLISEFVRGKDAILFSGIESTATENLENLSKSIHRFLNGTGVAPIYPSFETAFSAIFEISKSKRVIFVIDEYPYVAKSKSSISSVLQNLIDSNKDDSKLFLILCGSSMSFMEEQVLGYKSPLYGRRTAQFKISPFSFFEAAEYFVNFTKEEIAEIYGVAGGTPQYLIQMDDSLSVKENIMENILNVNSYLFEEPSNLLKQEVQKSALYNGIIAAIAKGSTKISEIATKTNEETSSVSTCIRKLLSLELIKKETPFGEDSGKKTIYSVNDNLFRFWYKFVPENLSLIQNGMLDTAYDYISKEFNSYMGAVFEDICKQYLWELNKRGETPFIFSSIGRWWGNNPQEKRQEEIDIMGEKDKSTALFAECKWTTQKVDTGVLESLILKSKMFHYENVHYYLFAKTDFTEGCTQKAKEMGNVTLVKLEDMF